MRNVFDAAPSSPWHDISWLFSEPCRFTGQPAKSSSETDGRTNAVEKKNQVFEAAQGWEF